MLARVLTYLRSQVLGLVAIFIALGGTGYAAVAIPRHSVGQPQLKNNAVGRSQLRKHSVTNGKLATSSIGAQKLKNGSVTSSKLAAGSVGSSQIATGAVGASQLGAGSVGAAAIAPASVGPSQLSGVGGYISAFAIVQPNGTVSSSDPAATTSSWSNGNGAITFASPVDGADCIPYSFVPLGVTSGTTETPANSYASPASGTVVSVSTNPPSGTSQLVVVEVLCAA